MADLFILALTVFTFQNNTKIAINIYLLDIFALFLVFSYQFTAKCLSLPPPLLGGAISKPLTLPFALAFRTSNIETVLRSPNIRLPIFHFHTTITENGYRTAIFDLVLPIFGYCSSILSFRSTEIGHGVAKIDLREPFSGEIDTSYF